MNYSVVLQSFGSENEYKRTIFCLISLFRFKNSKLNSVILYTDNPEYFSPYFPEGRIEYVKLNEAKIKLMRGEIDFLHRMKITMIEEAFRLKNNNMLYVDSDTFFLASPEPLMSQLSPQVSFMHKHEYQFNTLKDMPLPAGKPFQAFYNLLTSTEFALPNQSKRKISTQLSSWNAGAIALYITQKNLLPEIYNLTDQFYSPTKNHASEQYAFSIVLQTHSSVKPLDSIIYHYWYRVKKTVVDIKLKNLLTSKFSLYTEHKKAKLVEDLIEALPNILKNHVLILKDSSIQSFHENKFSKGFMYAFRVLLKDPFDWNFWLDIGYHFKRWLKKLFT